MNPGKSCWKSVYAFFVPGGKYFLKCKFLVRKQSKFDTKIIKIG